MRKLKSNPEVHLRCVADLVGHLKVQGQTNEMTREQSYTCQGLSYTKVEPLVRWIVEKARALGYAPSLELTKGTVQGVARESLFHPVSKRLGVDLAKRKGGLTENGAGDAGIFGEKIGPTFRAVLQTLRVHLEFFPDVVPPFLPSPESEPVEGDWTVSQIAKLLDAHGGDWNAAKTFMRIKVVAPLVCFFVAAVNAMAKPEGIRASNALVFEGGDHDNNVAWFRGLYPEDEAIGVMKRFDWGIPTHVIQATRHWITIFEGRGPLVSCGFKGFLDRSSDGYRPPREKDRVSVPRRTVFCASIPKRSPEHQSWDEEQEKAKLNNWRFWFLEMGECKLAELEKLDKRQLWLEVVWFAFHAHSTHAKWWLEQEEYEYGNRA